MTQIIIALAALLVAGLTWKIARILGGKQNRLVSLEHSLVDLLADRQEAKIKNAAQFEQQKIVEVAVDTGTASAEVVHKAVADVTFGVLDSIPVTEGASKLVRGMHDGIAGAIYSTVRISNKQIGSLTKGYLKLKQDYDAAHPKQAEDAEKKDTTPPPLEEMPATEKKTQGEDHGKT